MTTVSKFSSRKVFICPLFGNPQELKKSRLPTHEDVLRSCFQERYNLAPVTGSQEPKFSQIAENVADNVEEIYFTASIPTVSHTRVVKMITSYHDKYRGIMKPYKERKNNESYQTKIKAFLEEARKSLFDIAACKCKDFSACTCQKADKVPAKEHAFLKDQRTQRLGYIGSIDVKTTNVLQKRADRKANISKRLSEKSDDYVHGLCEDSPMDSELESLKPSELDITDEYQPNDVPSTSQMRIKLSATSIISDRYSLSDRAVAAVTSALLQDIGIVSKEDSSHVIDKSKIRRERSKTRKELQSSQEYKASDTLGIYFDGRKDKTLCQVKEGTKSYCRSVTEEHISLLLEPGSQYFGHLTPLSGSARSISADIIKFFKQSEVKMESISAVGCDGTVVNTGHKAGVIRLLEDELKKPLQWLICLLHFNELPLRHLFEHLDGKTSGPRSYSGPIGRSLEDVRDLPVVTFNRVECELPIVTSTDLSTDQKYLFEISQAVQSGECSEDLSRREPGPISHSRWLTTANRILRLYVGSAEPSSELITLVHYILKVYVNAWFNIKMRCSSTDGAKHLWQIIRNSRYLTDDLKRVVDQVISRNAFFAHPENLLLSMLADERAHIRELAVRRIIKARDVQGTEGVVRQFVVPKLNFDAADYIDLITWADCKVTEPPVVAHAHISSEELRSCSTSGSLQELVICALPCHTQAVERCIKLVTEASGSVCGHERRDGLIRATLASRTLMPSFETKADWRS